MPRILLVDDDPQSLESTKKILVFSGYEVVTAQDGQSALEYIRPIPGKPSSGIELVVTDVRMPRLGGLEFLRALSLCGETIPVILMTAFGRVEDAVWAMKLGAVDFLTKPFKRQTLLSSVEAALKRARVAPGSIASAQEKEVDILIGRSASMRELKELIQRVAPTLATVLVTGESGTGKERVARSIHLHSARAQKPFVALNCAAVPEQLMESELFGFERGAFTGATGQKEGLFESANGGTLLLDEIGDMPLTLQAKLLRVLQENEIRRLGANTSRKIDVRVIAATHRDLKEAVRAGTFRLDLLYRLEVISIPISPLRERVEDIPDLVQHFLWKAADRHEKKVLTIHESAMALLMAHSWPGNVRELSNIIERAVVLARGSEITSAELPLHLHQETTKPSTSSISVPLGTSLKDVEDLLIRKTLEATSGDKNMTAKILGINSRTIYRKLDKRPEKDSLEKESSEKESHV